MLQGISLKKRVRERKKEKKTQGDKASSSEAHYFIFKRDFYTLICTERGMKDTRSYRVSPNIPAVLPLLKPGFSSVYLFHKQCCVHYLLALESCEHFMTLF